jgi:hypothetical protein
MRMYGRIGNPLHAHACESVCRHAWWTPGRMFTEYISHTTAVERTLEDSMTDPTG